MRLLKIKLTFLCVLLALALLWAYPAAAQDKQWVDLVTGVSNNMPVTTRVFGYYADVKGFGQVFIICDPNTGEETGYAYVPGGVVGSVKKQAIDHYDRKEDLDWDHPKQINPPQVVLFAPNIPTSTEYDWDYYKQTGKLCKKAVNEFGWPMSYSFARYLPGSDPDYWLIIASVANPNPFPVEVYVDARIYWWRTSWGDIRGIPSKNITISLGPNETRYVLLNRGKQSNCYLCDEESEWDDDSYHQGWSSGYYDVVITKILSPDYPNILKSGDKFGYYTTYVRWDGTNPIVYPLIPMRLAFDFQCDSYDRNGSYWYYPYRGREFPACSGHAEYDPATGQWNIGLGFRYFKKPSGMSDAEWQVIYNTAVNKAVSALKPLFEKWYPKIPFMCIWWSDDEELQVDGVTGYYRFSDDNQGWPDGHSPTFQIDFRYLEPVPPNNAPPAPGSQYWWSNSRWGGWLYTTSGASSRGVELSAPIIQGYPDYPYERNWTTVSYKGDTVEVGRGTYVYHRNADVDYYDTDWMDELPVVWARPMFIEKYLFVPTQGDVGYLTRQTVPGYLLWVDTEDRPVLKTSTQPIEISAQCNYVDWYEDDYYKLTKQWKWTPTAGWQYIGTIKGNRSGYSKNQRAIWNVTIKTNHIVTGNNPNNFPGTWMPSWGGTLNFYWSKTSDIQTELTALADTVEERVRVHGDYEYVTVPLVDSISVDGWISGPSSVTLAANESKFICSTDKTFSIQFRRRPRGHYESWGESQQNVLNEISNNIIPLLSGDEETVFNENTVFVLGKTFKPGEGGVICGAQRKLIYRDWVWDSEWDDYGWDDDLSSTQIGFALSGNNNSLGFRIINTSYMSDYAPTDGLVVQSNDEILAQLLNLGENSFEIWLNGNTPRGARFWRFYDDGVVYPRDYPRAD